MRPLSLVALAACLVALAVLAFAAPSGAARAVFADAEVPASFAAGNEVVLGPGVTHQRFADLDAGRSVIVVGYSGWSRARRLAFRHGLGIARTTPHTYERVSVASLPVTSGLTANATSAFRVTDPDGTEAGTVVLGCEGDWCYRLGTQGPSTAAATPYAADLDGIRVRR